MKGAAASLAQPRTRRSTSAGTLHRAATSTTAIVHLLMDRPHCNNHAPKTARPFRTPRRRPWPPRARAPRDRRVNPAHPCSQRSPAARAQSVRETDARSVPTRARRASRAARWTASRVRAVVQRPCRSVVRETDALAVSTRARRAAGWTAPCACGVVQRQCPSIVRETDARSVPTWARRASRAARWTGPACSRRRPATGPLCRFARPTRGPCRSGAGGGALLGRRRVVWWWVQPLSSSSSMGERWAGRSYSARSACRWSRRCSARSVPVRSGAGSTGTERSTW